MSQEHVRRLLAAMLWVDIAILIASPLWVAAAQPSERRELITSLALLAVVACCSAILLRARPPPRG